MDQSKEIAAHAAAHVETLCRFGERVPGSAAETRTLDYVEGYLSGWGFEVRREPFAFSKFVSRDRAVSLNDHTCFFRSILVAGNLPVRGRALLLPSTKPHPDALSGHIVITDDLNGILRLGTLGATAVVVTSREDLEALRSIEGTSVVIDVPGEFSGQSVISHNIVAEPVSCPASRVLLSAHWDSKGGPGARDNASGVALAMELLRWSSRTSRKGLPASLVLTGAEESGLFGALSHVMRHIEHIVEFAAVLNTDSVVGACPGGIPYLSMRPPDADWLSSQKDDRNPELYVISLHDGPLSWYVSGSDIYWFSPTVTDTVLADSVATRLATEGLAWEEGGCCSGTDDRAFAFIGLPTIQQGFTSQSGNDSQHTELDTPGPHFQSDLQRSAQVSMAIIEALGSHDHQPHQVPADG